MPDNLDVQYLYQRYLKAIEAERSVAFLMSLTEVERLALIDYLAVVLKQKIQGEI